MKMSFSKAKIQRFNDIKPSAPSPAAYNIIKDKTKGALSHVEHSVDLKSPVLSETGSTRSTPCFFRTPTLLKRKKTAPITKSKPKELFTQDIEFLKEKIVECQNKDAFIKDLQEQIEEFKCRMNELEKQKSKLDLEKIEYDEQILKLKTEHEEGLQSLTDKYEKDMTKAKEDEMKIKEEIVLIRTEYEQLKEENKKEMTELKENCDKFHLLYNQSVEECKKIVAEKEAILENKEKELKALEENCIEIQRKHSIEIERLQKEHQIEVQDIEFEMLKMMTELQKEKENAANAIIEIETKMRKQMDDLRKGFDEERQRMLMKTESRVKQIEENFRIANLFTEAQLKERLDELESAWKQKLDLQEKQSDAILKECQAISEYNIIQCELEKNQALTTLTQKTEELQSVQKKYEDMVRNYDELNARFKDLQGDLSKVIVELNGIRQTLGEQLEMKSKEVKKLSEEKRAYELTIKNSQLTIDVLTKRLIHSDKDVEQLKKELSETEKRTLEYENKCVQLTGELKQAQMANEELEMQFESTIKLNTTEIEQIKAELVRKVNAYKSEVESFCRQLREEKNLSKEMFKQLHEAYEVVEKVKSELEHMEDVNLHHEFDSEQTQNELEDYRIREIDWSNEREKLENVIKEMENLLEIKQDEVRDLRAQLMLLQERSESHVQCLQYYKNKVEECEREIDEMSHIHRKYIEQSGKYDELLQRFEQLEMKHSQEKNKCLKMATELEEKVRFEEMYNKQREAYDNLLSRCKVLENENSEIKKKMEEPTKPETETEKDVLLDRIQYLEAELQEVSKKYTDLVGSNKKQSIQNLEAKNAELIQTNLDLEQKLRIEQKTLEKLKREKAELKKCLRKNKIHTEDKENIGSPNRSLNSSSLDSPFRERN